MSSIKFSFILFMTLFSYIIFFLSLFHLSFIFFIFMHYVRWRLAVVSCVWLVALKFSFENCKFKVQRSKEGTGRIVVWMLGITNSYTIEASFGGSLLGSRKGTHFTTAVSLNFFLISFVFVFLFIFLFSWTFLNISVVTGVRVFKVKVSGQVLGSGLKV